MNAPDNESDDQRSVLLLRLAGPLQSWGDRSAFNRRDTRPEPTKSGVIGLLAAAQGYARDAELTDLLGLHLAVRIDQPGTLLRDYHTVSDYRGRALPQAGVSGKGVQKATSPAKHTHVTTRFYLQDAVFLAAVAGPHALVEALDAAVRHPAFPLALGRRSCVPTQPPTLGLREGTLQDVLTNEPWQASDHTRNTYSRRGKRVHRVDLSATLEDPHSGDDVVHDVPQTFDPPQRRFTSRRVRHAWLSTPTGLTNAHAHESDQADGGHDPFALLGW